MYISGADALSSKAFAVGEIVKPEPTTIIRAKTIERVFNISDFLMKFAV
jgi:hypothetical protein